MRLFTTAVALAACLTTTAFALETSAGADTVNATQVGINAKIDATSAVLQTALSKVTNCGNSNQIYNPGTNTCVSVIPGTAEADPVAMPKVNSILACGDGNKIAHSNGTCSAAMPADQTATINAILTCNNQGKFYNSATGTCTASAGLKPKYMTKIKMTYAGPARQYQTSDVQNYDMCVLSRVFMESNDNSGGDCDVKQVGNGWQLWITRYYSYGSTNCDMSCFNFQ